MELLAFFFFFKVFFFPVDEWSGSSANEVEGIKEAVGSIMADVQQFSQSQQARNEVWHS